MAALGDLARIVAEAAAADAPPQRQSMRALPGLQSMRVKIRHLKAQRTDQTVILRKDLQIAHANFHGAVRQDDLIRLENPGGVLRRRVVIVGVAGNLHHVVHFKRGFRHRATQLSLLQSKLALRRLCRRLRAMLRM